MRIYCKGCGDPYGYLDLFKAFKISSLRLDDCKNCRCSDRCGCTIEERERESNEYLYVSTCMGCLNDFNDDDLVWQGGLLCVNCNEEGE